ncbi:MAG: NAD-dependent epimerase/dehydratase family protein, partial [Candidatus Shapirobacteria bacterium]|nr:NAD-dependent epimerase/dehydratase family protein [Candidatus Shapirobacteria bacterium]
MKVLIAGGAGFIGSHLCEKILKKGDEVFCMDNLLTGNLKNIGPFLKNKKFKFWQWDVTQKPTQKIAAEKFDAIFHLASPASPNPESPFSYLNYPAETLFANSLGTYNLLELANQDKAKFLFASTSEIYGDPQISPQPETYWGNVNPNGIRSCYDEAKRFGEAMTMVFVRKFKVNARIVRIFNTYGPKMDKKDGRVIVNFINQILEKKPLTVYGQGKQTRSFCYIDDTVEGLMSAMFKS